MNQPSQPSTITIRTNQHASKNCNRACLSVNAFLPPQKTNFFRNGSTSIVNTLDCEILITN